MTRFYDTHCHIDMEIFDDDRNDVISAALEAGVQAMNLVASTLDGFEKARLICEQNACLRPAYGFSPFEADKWPEQRAVLEEYLKSGAVAVGECGLDYYHDIHEPQTQMRCFIGQMELAAEFDLPVIIHCRDAWGDMRREIDAAVHRNGDRTRGVLHCFTGMPTDAKFFTERGFRLSFAGNLTYPSAVSIRESLLAAPPEFVLFETDSPYLHPIPGRGKRCEPARVVLTVEYAAQLLNQPVDVVAERSFASSCALFGSIR